MDAQQADYIYFLCVCAVPLGNILTVAEDLLENDGKKFLEMMDRLADRKVQRDDELMDNRGAYEEYDDDDEEGESEDEGPEEVGIIFNSSKHLGFVRLSSV